MKYDVDYFINKFEAIPENKWCIGTFTTRGDAHCALGHCAVDSFTNFTLEAEALAILLYLKLGTTVTSVNDWSHTPFTQETPKKRILAALYKIKEIETADSAVEEFNKIVAETVGELEEIT